MKKVITFDFDDTLFVDPVVQQLGLWIPAGSDAIPLLNIHDYLKEKHNEGYEVHVVSFRAEKYKQEMIDLCKLYDLPVKTFTCTESKSKTLFLQSLRSEIHVDDSVSVLVLAEQVGIKGLLVDWDQDDINSTSKLLEKINPNRSSF
jgi:FMN phosphatase YigB (HAD superfamily)